MQKADDLEMVNANMVPPLLEAVLVDYNRNVPDAREAEVLNVMTTIIHKLHVRQAPLIDIEALQDEYEADMCCYPELDGRQSPLDNGKRL